MVVEHLRVQGNFGHGIVVIGVEGGVKGAAFYSDMLGRQPYGGIACQVRPPSALVGDGVSHGCRNDSGWLGEREQLGGVPGHGGWGPFGQGWNIHR